MKNNNSLNEVFMETVKCHCKRVYTVLTQIDIHPGQEHLLMNLLKKDGQSQRDLVKELGIKPATSTVMVQRMEKNGLVRREKDKSDQRISRIFITDKGREVSEKIKKIQEELEEKCFKNFTTEEKIVFRRLLLQMQENLEQEMEEK